MCCIKNDFLCYNMPFSVIFIEFLRQSGIFYFFAFTISVLFGCI